MAIRSLAIVGAAASALALGCVGAQAAGSGTTGSSGVQAHITVSPGSGGPHTTFTLSFRSAQTIGHSGTSILADNLEVTAPSTAKKGCIPTVSTPTATIAAGGTLRVRLDPKALGGVWCAGTYSGKIVQEARPYCRPSMVCPQYIELRGVVGTFTFKIS